MPINDSRIEHLVVLMLENRSFDHMLGFSGIPGIDGLTGAEWNPDPNGEPVRVSNDAQYIGDLDTDPGHELVDVNIQMYSNEEGRPGLAPPMMGFVKSFLKVSGKLDQAKKIMKCFGPNRLPVLTALARQYAVCDRWFSSVPGPTLPNRVFMHAGTSQGEAACPRYFSNLRTIYPLLNKYVPAKIFYQDWTMAFTFRDLLGDQTRYFGRYQDFLNACEDGSLPNYCLLEPRYYADDSGGVHEPNDQHPDHDVREAENLIREVYMALRANPAVWQKTMLLIVYDEHGGLYDHVEPPLTVNPDGQVSKSPPFDFTRLGPRVPAVIVSPYIKPGTVDHTVYDHTSVIATARKLFLPDWTNTALTKRDAAANTFDGVLTLATPRSNPLIAHAATLEPGETRSTSKDRKISCLQCYMVRVAHETEEQELPLEERTGQTPNENWTESEAVKYLNDVAERLRKRAQ